MTSFFYLNLSAIQIVSNMEYSGSVDFIVIYEVSYTAMGRHINKPLIVSK